MKINTETLKAYLESINDELVAVIRNHESANSQFVRIGSSFSNSKAEFSWVVAKVFLEIVQDLNTNLDSLNKMHSLLFRVRIKVFLLNLFQIFSPITPTAPNLEYFSWLLDKVTMNLQKTFDEINSSFLLPLLQTNDKSTQPLIVILDGPLDNIKNSLTISQNIKHILSKFILENQEKTTSLLTELENSIYDVLLETVPAAATSYKQAVIDLADVDRISYRGVANEFREALRETLDFLAPEDRVTAQPNFRFENGKTNSTMKQKVRYILKSRGSVSNALKTPEEALEIIEDRIASFARATYERSSISTHIASERSEVQQIKLYTNAILVELLRITFDNGISRQ